MIDIHNHILPDLTDGTKGMKTSLEIAKSAINHGIETIIAAPRYVEGEHPESRDKVIEKVADLNSRLDAENLPLKVVPGQKVQVSVEMIAEQVRENFITLATVSNYLLIELPEGKLPDNLREQIFDLQMHNLIPILANPELNQTIQEYPDEIYQYVKNGALVQIAVDSVLGKNGGKAKKLTNKLLGANLVHLVASGNHHEKKNVFQLKDAYQHIEKAHGIEISYYLQDNIRDLIEGYSINGLEPVRIKGKKLFGLL